MTPRSVAGPNYSNTPIPEKGSGAWTALQRKYSTPGLEMLSANAQAILLLAVSYPCGQVPGQKGLYEAQRDALAKLGKPYLGDGAVKKALKELKDSGHYATRFVGGGRGKGFIVRSFSTIPHRHIIDLAKASREELLKQQYPSRGDLS